MPALLTSLMRRARSEPWLVSGLKMGLSFNSVYRTLLGQKVSYRRTDMLRRWNTLKGFAANVEVISKMYLNKPIPNVRHLYPEGSIGDAYRYRTESLLRHMETGEEHLEPFTILSDHALSFEEIKADVRRFLLRYPDLEVYAIIETRLTEATQRRSK